jgi:hypothetical protein
MELKRIKTIYYSWSLIKSIILSIESQWLMLGKWCWRSIFKNLEAFSKFKDRVNTHELIITLIKPIKISIITVDLMCKIILIFNIK